MQRKSAIVTFALAIAAAAHAGAQPIKRAKKFAIPGDSIRQLVAPMGGAFATDRITVERHTVDYMYREAPSRKEDSGWRFFAGDEDQAYIDDLSHTEVYSVNTVANYDPDIVPYLDTPAPCAFEKIPGTHKYRRVK